MRRKVLLVEPNYKNKFPPIALMKLSTYFKSKGDDVFFFKGDVKDLILDRVVSKCIEKLQDLDKSIIWTTKFDIIRSYIKTKKSSLLNELNVQDTPNELLILNWLAFYKDYYWRKLYLGEPEWDFIGVTTLFTFYFDITVRTINELKPLLKPSGIFQVGGVLATLQADELETATGIKPHKGLLNTPGVFDPEDTQVIDCLPLDYTILEETDYKYDMSNAYYGYVTRGCIRHCAFCAVPKLEPVYEDYIPLKERVDKVREICGDQRDLLLMDNNVLASQSFDKIIEDIILCGFASGATFTPNDQLELSVKNLRQGINDRGYIRKTQFLLKSFLDSIKDKDLSYDVYSIMYRYSVLKYETSTKENLLKAYNDILPTYKQCNKPAKPIRRSVDFNQGVDARLFTPHIAKQLARIAVSPLRIAFDDMSTKGAYLNAIGMCARNGLKNFSNYLLYNFNDKPADLYERMKINAELCEELDINIYSFPMKYHPLYGEHSHDRNYIGKHWNMKYIRAVQAVLNSTHGMIGRGLSYFYKAFGKSVEEYMSILEMPDTYIIYRFFFEWLDTKNHPMSMSSWANSINSLNNEERMCFYEILHSNDHVSTETCKNPKVLKALSFYRNNRDEISNKSGSLYELKQEFDSLDKEVKDQYRNTGNALLKM